MARDYPIQKKTLQDAVNAHLQDTTTERKKIDQGYEGMAPLNDKFKGCVSELSKVIGSIDTRFVELMHIFPIDLGGFDDIIKDVDAKWAIIESKLSSAETLREQADSGLSNLKELQSNVLLSEVTKLNAAKKK
jgi:hypothetical protein